MFWVRSAYTVPFAVCSGVLSVEKLTEARCFLERDASDAMSNALPESTIHEDATLATGSRFAPSVAAHVAALSL